MKKKNLLVLGIALGMFGGTIQGAAQTVMQENNIQEVATRVRNIKYYRHMKILATRNGILKMRKDCSLMRVRKPIFRLMESYRFL